MPTGRQLLTALAAKGRHLFTTPEAAQLLGSTPVAVRAVLRRLAAKGEIASPLRGFHVLVPPEYRSLGCPPAEQFVPQLMDHLGLYHYAALLTAAEFHGAAPHRPQQFQVMVRTSRKPISCGAVRVQFTARSDLERTPVLQRNTPRGVLRLASPEATALELVGYASHCGGMDHVLDVLEELAPALDPVRLVAASQTCPVAWAQRLGYLLDLLDQRTLTEPLVAHTAEHARVNTRLLVGEATAGSERLPRWRLLVNGKVALDR